MNQNFNGGTHHHNYYQREIPFEKRDKRVTIVFTETEIESINKISEGRGYPQIGPFLRHLISIGLKTEKYLNSTLADILK